MNVTVVMTGDEESSGDPQSVARARPSWRLPKVAHAAIGFEDGDGHPQHAVIGRRGTASWTLKRHRHTGALLSDFPGRHRLRRGVRGGSRILNAFREKLAGQEHLTFNPALVPRRDRR